MSPIALFYLLLASPVLNTPNWLHNESPINTFPASWNSWNTESYLPYTPYSSIYESPIYSNIFSNVFSSTPRSSILRELTGRRFESPMTSTMSPLFNLFAESPIRAERLLRRVAEVNPIFASEMFSRPETRFAVEKLLSLRRPVEEKIIRRLIKKLIKNSIYSTRRSSIVNELFATPFSAHHESLFNTRRFEESPIFTKIAVEKVLRRLHSVSPVEKLIRKSINKNVEFCNVCENMCESSSMTPFPTSNWGMCSICEKVCNTWTPMTPSFSPLNKERVVRKLVKAIVLTKKFSTKKHLCKVADRVCESATFEKVLSKKINKVCKVAEVVCEKVVFPAVATFESVESPIFAGKLIKKLVKESLRMEEPIFSGRRFF